VTPDIQADMAEKLGGQLLKAAMLQDAKEAKRLLAAGAPVDIFNRLDHTPLIIAAATGNLELAAVLLDGKADPNTVSEKGSTALVAAKTPEMAELLLSRGANPLAADPAFYPLLVRRAAQLGNEKLFRALVDAGAPFVPDDGGKTVLMYAAEGNCPGIIRQALKACKDVNEKDKHGISALIHAAKAGSGAGVALLLEAGANANEEFNNQTALSYAAEKGDAVGVEALLKHGAKANTSDRDDGKAPLRMAIKSGNIECVRMILEAGADPLNKGYDEEKKLSTTDEQIAQETNSAIAVIVSAAALPFHIAGAAGEGQTDRVAELLDGGVEVDFVNRKGETALLRACMKGKTDTAKYLLSRGANASYKNPDDNTTPLRGAMKHEDPALFEALLAAGAKTDELSKNGEPPLFAVLKKPVKFVDTLLQHGADPNFVLESDGRTAIYRAIEMRDISLVEHLIAGGARVNRSDKEGVTPLMLADACGKDMIVQAVKEQYVRELEEMARDATSLNNHVSPLKKIKFRGPATP
jgi:ankyrin repeat protein